MWIAIIGVLFLGSVKILLFAKDIVGGIQFGMELAKESKPRLVKTSTSLTGRWKVKIFYVNPGALGSAFYRADVVDSKEAGSSRSIYSVKESEGDPAKTISWKDSNTIVLDEQQIDVRKRPLLPF